MSGKGNQNRKNTNENAKKFHVEHLRITLKPTLGYKVKNKRELYKRLKEC